MRCRAALAVVVLLLVIPACSGDESTDHAWEADLDGYLEWEQTEACADRNADGVATTTIAEGTMGELGPASARFVHCPSESGMYYDGAVTFATTDGDELWGEYDEVTDTFAADPQSWPIQITGGTGEFSEASGTVYLMSYQLDWGADPPGWSGQLEGTVSY